MPIDFLTRCKPAIEYNTLHVCSLRVMGWLNQLSQQMLIQDQNLLTDPFTKLSLQRGFHLSQLASLACSHDVIIASFDSAKGCL